ncbi:ASCH domain-containing protein [Paenibacillus wynnii]|uniref:2-oxoglutarate dehydrogenase E1 n=1 Tax=Paenibacillus wynnii TaxID=268407 RepID=A0A098MC09_9BACL|nr:ASCH domain-containing protein [Paenibacillus wynnii]KGE19588.1 2-oxoglutarate dehydrogenase E1 [Paenibacillus wynnii]
MLCLTIRQPWATLIALGEKEFETRSWRTNHRGELAIHAGKKIDKAICRQEPFKSVLLKHGYTEDNLPVGVIIAKGLLEDCYEITHDGNGKGWVSGNEYAFGDYTEGRFAWKLADITPLIQPISAKGKLSLWEYPSVSNDQEA